MLVRTFGSVVVRPEAKLWWDQARRDFQVGQRNHSARDYDFAVFLFEQATQKALKSLIIHRTGNPPPRVHNLVRLGDIVGIEPGFRAFLENLTPHYVLTRYPDAARAVTKSLYDGRTSLTFLRGTQKVMK